jgi:hypothetical protein
LTPKWPARCPKSCAGGLRNPPSHRRTGLPAMARYARVSSELVISVARSGGGLYGSVRCNAVLRSSLPDRRKSTRNGPSSTRILQHGRSVLCANADYPAILSQCWAPQATSSPATTGLPRPARLRIRFALCASL